MTDRKKIGIIYGGELCQGALGAFSEDLANAFEKLGHDVCIIQRHETERLVSLLSDPSYDAIIGFQDGLFTQVIKGVYLGDLTEVPKFNVMFDTPSFARVFLKHPLKSVRYLYQDELYVNFVKTYYPNLKTYHFPIGGSMGSVAQSYYVPNSEQMKEQFYAKRNYDLSFIGYYSDYRKALRELESEDEQRIELCLDYFDRLTANPNMNSHAVYRDMMTEKAPDMEREAYLNILESIYRIENAVSAYYREKVIGDLLRRGVIVHVFAKGWREAPYANAPNLVIHDEIPYRESLDIMAQSKMTMNVFSWHKGGMTERISNSLLNGAVCVTDRSSFIDRNFTNGKEMLVFDLTDTDTLVDSVMELLCDDEKRIEIARAGFKAGYENYRWINCARRILELL